MTDIKIGVSLVNYHNTEEIFNIAKKYLNIPNISAIAIVNNDCDNTDTFLLNSLNERVRIFNESDNLGYSKGNNVALKYLIEEFGCDFAVISNSDIDFDDEMITVLYERMQKENNYGAMAPRMLQSDGTVLSLRYIDLDWKRIVLRVIIPSLDKRYERKVKNKRGIYDQSFLPGSFFMVRGKAIKECNYFDPNVFLYREEEILGCRLRKIGYRLGVIDNLLYTHNHMYSEQSISQTYKMQVQSMKSERYYFRKYCGYKGLAIVHVFIWQFIFIIRELAKQSLKSMIHK